MINNIKVVDLDQGLTDVEAKVVALGNFDGVHIGHKKLMQTNIEIAKSLNLVPSVLLFKENSKKTLTKESLYLTSIDDKIDILSKMGIEDFCILEFDDEFKSLSPLEFIRDILYKKLNTNVIVVGSDYKFGKNASGNVDTLKKYEDEFSYKTKVVDFIYDGNEKISSGTIRELIKSTDIYKANEYLGRPYQIRGLVTRGYQRGRTLNFPTANLKLSYDYVIPADGVYLTRVNVKSKSYFALTNIGKNPTFENMGRKIETNILDFSADIYDELMCIEFLEFFRGDIKFDSADELIEQMETDKKMAYEIIKNKYL